MDTAAKTDAARTAFERPVLADQISSVGETKSKAKEDGTKKKYIPPEKHQQIIDDLRLF